jgi:multidrug efflux pump subunit AcrA (membrane-fusion protein)
MPQIPELHNKQVQKVHQNQVRLVRELAEQERTVALAKAKYEAALAADVDAAAQARLEARPRPKPTASKADEELKDARSELSAARLAVEKAEQAVADTIERSLPELKQQAGKRVQGARAKFISALDALTAAHAELAIEEAGAAWLRQWPNGKGNVGARYVTDLPPARNGDPLTTDAVLDALRKRGLPPEPHRPPGALRAFEPGTVVVREPMIETLIGPQAA